MSSSNIEDEITDLKHSYSVKTDTELAAALHVHKSTVSSWRRKGSVPAHIKDLGIVASGHFDQTSIHGKPVPPAFRSFSKWTQQDHAAFKLALFRFFRENQENMTTFPGTIRTLSDASAEMANLAYYAWHEIAERMSAESLTINDTISLIVFEEIEAQKSSG